MKKSLLSTLICASLSVSAFAEPTFYGKANVSAQRANEGDASTTELVSNASRVGFKGGLVLEDGLEAIYQAEYEIFVDDAETFTQRNIFVGLKGGFGTVKAGKFDSPLKEAQNKVDLFNDLEGDIKAIVTVNDNRPDNIVSYQSPLLGAFTAKVALIASEADDEDDGFSGSLAFEQDGIYAAVAVDQNVEAEDVDVVRLVGQYNFTDFQIGALYEQVDADGFDKSDAVFASFQYTLDKIVLKAQLGRSEFVVVGGIPVFDDADTLSFGLDYKLAKNVKVFGYFTQNQTDNDAIDNDYLGAGVELVF